MTEAPEQPKSIDLVEDWDDLTIEEKGAALKATVTVPEVAQLMGIEADEGDKIPSPWNPAERTPSCHLYDDHWYDYSTGRWGDIFDLVIAVNPGTTMGQAIEAIKKRAVAVGKQYGDVEAAVPRELLDFTEQLGQYPVLDVWDQDPRMDLPVRAFGLREDREGNVYVPHREPGRVYGVKVRWAAGGKGSWAGSQYTHRLYDPYGWNPSTMPGRAAIICEGESDCWALISVVDPDYDVFALPSGVGTWRDHWIKDLQCYSKIYICVDNDAAGKRERDKLMLKVGYSIAERLDVPQLYNDAREAIQAGWRPSLP